MAQGWGGDARTPRATVRACSVSLVDLCLLLLAQLLWTCKEAYVYKIPPLKNESGHRANDWDVNTCAFALTPAAACSLSCTPAARSANLP